jgi:hypothetical protein
MKFLGGFIVGVVTTILVLFLFYTENESAVPLTPNDTLAGLTIFPEKGECITKNEIEILQTLKPNMALARSGKFSSEILVLLINHEGEIYYDDKKIKILKNKCAKQIGTYRYETTGKILKTVPAVVIE